VKAAANRMPPVALVRPEVLVDFTVTDYLLSIHLKNVGATSAYLVTTSFDRPFYGLNGTKCISSLRLFRKLEFLPPGKTFSQFVDRLAAYARSKQPMRVAATISYRDRDGHRYQERIVHDLRIYLELGEATIVRAASPGR
jgi:hypothetical protein